MFLLYSRNQIAHTLKQTLGIVLIAGLLVMSGPTPYLFADEGAPEEVPAPPLAQPEELASEPEEVAEDVPGEAGDDGDAGVDGEPNEENDIQGEDGENNEEAGENAENGEDTLNQEEAEDFVPEGEGIEGEEGEDGNDLGPEEGASDATVETGDGVVTGTIINGENTNTTDTEFTTPGSTSTPDNIPFNVATSTATSTDGTHSATTTATTTQELEYEDGYTVIDQTITTNNNGSTTNSAYFGGNTGSNSAGSSANATVVSGNSVVTANVVNVVNTNIVNSNGAMAFLDFLFEDATIDVTDWFDLFGEDRDERDDRDDENRSVCDLTGCDEADIAFHVDNDSDAMIDNDVILRSSSADNVAIAGNGTALVSTGDAYAAANVTNVANTNIVNSNYLLLNINNFGDLSQNVVFPGMDFFTTMMAGNGPLIPNNTSVNNDNTLNVDTNALSDGSTGNNLASTSAQGGSMSIDTGDSYSGTNVLNQLNQNLFGGTSIQLVFQIHGNWSGDIFGLPAGIVWEETPGGIVLKSDPDYTGGGTGASLGSGDALAIAGSGAGGNVAFAGAHGSNALAVSNRNHADIRNNVEVYALTGDNRAESMYGNAVVNTGDAYAAANVTNIANTNVVGQNWVTAIFNIFGDWDGNITFGQTDLWIGGRAEALAGGFYPGAPVALTYTVTNFGDMRATDVTVTPTFDNGLLQLSGFGDRDGDRDIWNLGDLEPGESEEIVVQGIIHEDTGLGKVPISIDATVDSNEGESNLSNNSEKLTMVSFKGSRGRGSRVLRQEDANLIMEKRLLSPHTMSASSSATYEIMIKNRGGPAYYTVLSDAIYDPNGSIIHAQTWELETIYPDEEIYITYDVFYNASTTPGVYRNVAGIQGVENHDSLQQAYGKEFVTDAVTAEVEILKYTVENDDDVQELVAAYAADTEGEQCQPYLNDYIMYGEENSIAEVARLQNFLNKFEDANIAVTGDYDFATFSEVHKFQRKYSTDILGPWGIGQTTGFVYYTTQKKINEIYCGYQVEFPLSDTQLNEIEGFKAKLEEFDSMRESELDLNSVGLDPEAEKDLEKLADDTEKGIDPLLSGEKPIVGDGVRVRAPKTPAQSQAKAETVDMKTSFADTLREGLTKVMQVVSYQIQKAKKVAMD